MSEAQHTRASKRAPLITVVSASGGVGKSALCLMAACLSARSGLKTALVEADLQFGDIGFWLGLDNATSSLAQGTRAMPLELLENLDLYKAPSFPELAEELSEQVAALVSQIRGAYDIVWADTGGFWSGLTAELLVQSDANILMADQRPSSVAGAIRAIELCQRMGVPDARRVCVYNRWSQRARLSAEEVQQTLGATELCCIPDGKRIVDELLCAGDAIELIEMENAFACGVDKLLDLLLPRVGCAYERVVEKRKRRWAL